MTSASMDFLEELLTFVVGEPVGIIGEIAVGKHVINVIPVQELESG